MSADPSKGVKPPVSLRPDSDYPEGVLPIDPLQEDETSKLCRRHGHGPMVKTGKTANCRAPYHCGSCGACITSPLP